MPNEDPGFQELVRILENAARAGVASIRLEYEDRELMVFFEQGALGIGADRIKSNLKQPVIDELWKYARPSKKLRVTLLDKPYVVAVRKYENFGEWEFQLSLKPR